MTDHSILAVLFWASRWVHPSNRHFLMAHSVPDSVLVWWALWCAANSSFRHGGLSLDSENAIAPSPQLSARFRNHLNRREPPHLQWLTSNDQPMWTIKAPSPSLSLGQSEGTPWLLNVPKSYLEASWRHHGSSSSSVFPLYRFFFPFMIILPNKPHTHCLHLRENLKDRSREATPG